MDTHSSPAPSPASHPAIPARRRSLVTGATGLLGSNLVRLLLTVDEEVVALVRDADRAKRLLPDDPRLRVATGDITAPVSYRHLLRDVEEVHHTAAYFREYLQHPARTDPLEEVNVRAVGCLLHEAAAAGIPTVVHTSSINTLAVRGPATPADEDTPPPPELTGQSRSTSYAASKVRAERLVAEFAASAEGRDMRVPVVLPGWMWGPGDAGPTSAGRLFLGIARSQARAVPRLANYVVDARDVALACVAAARVGQHDRYVVAGVKHGLARIGGAVATETGVATPRPVPAGLAMAVAGVLELQARLRGREPVATRTGVRVLRDADARHITSARVERELGVEFRPLEETIADTARWYRENGYLARAG